MFTGIIKEFGRVTAVRSKGRGIQYDVYCPQSSSGAQLGASVAVDGVCQTVVKNVGEQLTFDAIDETLGKTSLGQLKVQQRVHLEPALRIGDPIDGHLVHGHVDGLGTVRGVQRQSSRWDLTVRLPLGCERYCIEGGSIALMGTSLTVFKYEHDCASVSLIPETLERTLFESLKVGDLINVEVDAMGKWVESLLQKDRSGGIASRLEEWGYSSGL